MSVLYSLEEFKSKVDKVGKLVLEIISLLTIELLFLPNVSIDANVVVAASSNSYKRFKE